MITINDKKNQYSKSSFGNAAALNGVMNYLATNQAIGASATDMGFMVIPRTGLDFTRTPEAGIETGRRELASCLLYAGMGFFGLGAAHMVGIFSDSKKYGVPYHKICAGSDSINTMAHVWKNSLDEHNGNILGKKSEITKKYLNEIFDSITGLDGESKIALNAKGTAKNEIVEDLSKLLNEQKDYKIPTKQRNEFIQKIINTTGSSEHLTLSIKNKEPIKLSAGDLLDQTYGLGRAFSQEKVSEELKNTKNITESQFVKSLTKFSRRKMIVGLGLASGIAISMQAVNRWMTKKKTGSDAFVVYKDKNGEAPKKDTSTGFKAMKLAASAAMGLFVAKTIGNWKEIPKKLEFTKLMPNMSQYKYIYGVTIIGRFLASSDKNELRESASRDVLGFTSWLVLGDVAARAIARMFEKRHSIKLLNLEKPTSSEFERIMKSHMKTHEELLYAADKNVIGQSVKDASKTAGANTKKALKYLNICQLSGYGISGLLLGVGIPMLNKAITNHLQKRKAAKAKLNQPTQLNKAA